MSLLETLECTNHLSYKALGKIKELKRYNAYLQNFPKYFTSQTRFNHVHLNS